MTMTATRRTMPAPLPRSLKLEARIPAALLMHGGKRMRTANHGTQ
jgi:hypothetical protein